MSIDLSQRSGIQLTAHNSQLFLSVVPIRVTVINFDARNSSFAFCKVVLLFHPLCFISSQVGDSLPLFLAEIWEQTSNKSLIADELSSPYALLSRTQRGIGNQSPGI